MSYWENCRKENGNMLEKPARADSAAGGTAQKTTSYLSCGDVPKMCICRCRSFLLHHMEKSSLYTLYKLYTVRYEGCMINRRNNPNYFVVLQRCSLLRSSFARCNEKHVCCSTATWRNAASSWKKSFSLTMKVVM